MIAPVLGSRVTLTSDGLSFETFWDVGMDKASLRRFSVVVEVVLVSVPPVWAFSLEERPRRR